MVSSGASRYVSTLFTLLMLVLFQGYKVFTRGNDWWNQPGDSWGFQLAPFTVIAGFILIFIAVYTFGGKHMFHVPGLQAVDLANGRAPVLAESKETEPKWKAIVGWVLNAI